MARKLRVWNGRPYGLLPASQWKRDGNTASVYACAHSAADLRALCVELGLSPIPLSELRNYWSPCWGTPMNGIEPERGIWVKYGYNDKPVRLERKPA